MVMVEGEAEASTDEVVADAALALIENNRLLRRIYWLAIVGLSLVVPAVLVVAWVVVREYGLS